MAAVLNDHENGFIYGLTTERTWIGSYCPGARRSNGDFETAIDACTWENGKTLNYRMIAFIYTLFKNYFEKLPFNTANTFDKSPLIKALYTRDKQKYNHFSY